MNVTSKIKALFPEKPDEIIANYVINPCENCDCDFDICDDRCVLGRLWKLYDERKKKEKKNDAE